MRRGRIISGLDVEGACRHFGLRLVQILAGLIDLLLAVSYTWTERGGRWTVRVVGVMVMKGYETRCVLLAPAERERLSRSRLRRDSQFSHGIATAESHLLGHEDLTRIGIDRESGATEITLESAAPLEKIVNSAVALVTEGVDEFAHALLTSQGRLGVHANILREYAASLVNEVRSRVASMLLLPFNPPLSWAQDPIAQKAMETCERAIAERITVGDRWHYQRCDPGAGNLTWPHIVQAWEAHKAIHGGSPSNPRQGWWVRARGCSR
jgi:hypothetical protein